MAGAGEQVFVYSTCQAEEAYDEFLAKFGATEFADKGLKEKAAKISAASQLTAFESQIVRSLRKPQEEQLASLQKYFGVYAHVPVDAILPQLHEAARKVLDKATAVQNP
jgi:hypothetical protein